MTSSARDVTCQRDRLAVGAEYSTTFQTTARQFTPGYHANNNTIPYHIPPPQSYHTTDNPSQNFLSSVPLQSYLPSITTPEISPVRMINSSSSPDFSTSNMMTSPLHHNIMTSPIQQQSPQIPSPHNQLSPISPLKFMPSSQNIAMLRTIPNLSSQTLTSLSSQTLSSLSSQTLTSLSSQMITRPAIPSLSNPGVVSSRTLIDNRNQLVLSRLVGTEHFSVRDHLLQSNSSVGGQQLQFIHHPVAKKVGERSS